MNFIREEIFGTFAFLMCVVTLPTTTMTTTAQHNTTQHNTRDEMKNGYLQVT